MRRLVLALVALAAFALAPPAQAKQIALVQICGVSGCRAIRPAIVLGGERGLRSTAPPRVGEYYALRVGDGDGRATRDRGQQYYFVADAGAVIGREITGSTAGWATIRRAAARLRALATTLKAFPPPHPASVWVDGRRAPDPGGYVALAGPLHRVSMRWTGQLLVSIDLRWSSPNPWSDSSALLDYLPGARALLRLDGYFHVPAALADRIDRLRHSA